MNRSRITSLNLPILPALDELGVALRNHYATVLQAPPGAGKTTVVPIALLDEEWLSGKKIVMLEPRRLAARGAAWRIAELLGEDVGRTAGYRMRGESRVSRETRIEIVTEGVLTRMLQNDPALEGIGLVIFDEFHERSLQADLGLALTIQARELFRHDLKVLVMSATLDAEPVARLLDDAPVVTSEGRSYPVEHRYVGRDTQKRIEEQVAATVARALRDESEGDLLVFLPGFGEIRRAESMIADRLASGGPGERGVEIHALHGSLPREAQDRAIRPAPSGKRKIVLATSIAETSLTIEGVRVVIDSGLSRLPRFSPRTGMTSLETARVSRASAEQRCGRAGRLAPGVCYRLWNEAENAALLPTTPPEILDADLASLALELARWGASPEDLRWLQPPPSGAYTAALGLLRELDAVTSEGTLTEQGKRMAELPVHPRLAHMLLRSSDVGAVKLSCILAALVEERDLIRGDLARNDPDVRLRFDLLRRYTSGERRDLPVGFDRGVADRVLKEAGRIERIIGDDAVQRAYVRSIDPFDEAGLAGVLLALAYPDRIAQRREGSGREGNDARYLLSNGRSARIAGISPLSNEEYIVAATLGGSGTEATIESAAPISLEQLRRFFSRHIEMVDVVEWLGQERGISARRDERLGALILSSRPTRNPDGSAVARASLEAVRKGGLGLLSWTDELKALRERVTFLHRRYDAAWPDLSDAALIARLDEWLLPALMHAGGNNRLRTFDLRNALAGFLAWDQLRDLDTLAPERVEVPSGSRIRIDYSDPDDPVLPVRLQEMFGARETPRIAGGRVPLTIHLLSPARRPVQVTRDLAGFWERTYAEVKKELKGRYPKHYWPDDPHQATPTSRTRPR